MADKENISSTTLTLNNNSSGQSGFLPSKIHYQVGENIMFISVEIDGKMIDLSNDEDNIFMELNKFQVKCLIEYLKKATKIME